MNKSTKLSQPNVHWRHLPEYIGGLAARLKAARSGLSKQMVMPAGLNRRSDLAPVLEDLERAEIQIIQLHLYVAEMVHDDCIQAPREPRYQTNRTGFVELWPAGTGKATARNVTASEPHAGTRQGHRSVGAWLEFGVDLSAEAGEEGVLLWRGDLEGTGDVVAEED